jgi:hypothetical protein
MKLAEDHTPLVRYCSGADVYAAMWRGPVRCKMPEANIQAILPKFIVNVIRQVLRRVSMRSGNEL